MSLSSSLLLLINILLINYCSNFREVPLMGKVKIRIRAKAEKVVPHISLLHAY